MRFRRAALAAALLVGSGAAGAETPVTYTQDGAPVFTLTVPDFWSVRTGGARVIEGPEGEGPRAVPRVIALEPTAERGGWMGFMSPPGITSLAEGRDYLREISRFLAFDPVVTETETRTVAGLPAELFTGTGRRNGRDIQFTVALIDLPNDRVTIAAAVVEGGTDPVVFDAINATFASLRAAR